MPPKVNDAQDLMLMQLGEMLCIERMLADQVLPEVGKEVSNSELRQGVEAHTEQTREHVRNIEKAFELLGQEPKEQPSHVLDGLKKTHDQMAPRIERDDLRDVFDAGAMAKTEHIEIAAYRDMIRMCDQMGMREVKDLLETNCKQEEQTLERIEAMTADLTKQIAAAA